MARALVGALLSAALIGCPGPAPDSGPDALAIPKPEHPRPDWKRDTWTSLNGTWRFGHDPDDVGLDERWSERADALEQEITVPFAFEAPASGLGEPWPEDGSAAHALTDPTYQGVSWYQRSFAAPAWAGADRTFIVFGAVDWRATVWLNGQELGSHEGGWLPFELELTDALRPGINQLSVRVEDWSEDEPDILIGKQGGSWYTRSSGIWQTVYLEGRPESYLAGAWFHPDWETGVVELELEIEGEIGQIELSVRHPRSDRAEVTLPLDDEPYGELRFDLTRIFENRSDLALWSPKTPDLYDVTLRTEHDEVHSYFGVRGLGLDWAPGHGPDDGVPESEQFQVFHINGNPIYLRGVLDQNYHPDGLLTYPDEDALIADLELAKEAGFNLVRVHIMHPEPRKLYHADRLGLMVMQDIPTPEAQLLNVEGTPYRDYWRADLEAAYRRDHNHPSLVSWVLFNEAWGLMQPDDLCSDDDLQQWVLDSVAFARELDPSRWIEDESTTDVWTGVFDHTETDFTSWHYYSRDWEEIDEHLDEVVAGSTIGGDLLYCDGYTHQGQPLLLSEFAGCGCYETVGLTGQEIGQHFIGWVDAVRARPQIAGHVFTQLTDVEWERNGLVMYGRDAKALSPYGVDELAYFNGPDAVVISGSPGQTLGAGETVTLDLTLARGGDGLELVPRAAELDWFWVRLRADDDEYTQGDLLATGEFIIDETGWGLNPAGSVTIEGPGEDAVLIVYAEVSSGIDAAGWRVFEAESR